jgi:hypothetical protein
MSYNHNWGPDTGPDGPDNSRIDEAVRPNSDMPGMPQEVGPYKHSTWGTPIHNGEGLSDWDGYGRQT